MHPTIGLTGYIGPLTLTLTLYPSPLVNPLLSVTDYYCLRYLFRNRPIMLHACVTNAVTLLVYSILMDSRAGPYIVTKVRSGDHMQRTRELLTDFVEFKLLSLSHDDDHRQESRRPKDESDLLIIVTEN